MLKHFRLLIPALILVGLVSDQSAQAATKPVVIKREMARYYIGSKKKILGKEIVCNFTRPTSSMGFVSTSKGTKRFSVLSSSQAKEAKKRKLDKVCQTVCSNQLHSIEVAVQENQSTTITPAMVHAVSCTAPGALKLTTPPAHGTTTLSGLNVIYTPALHYIGTDRLVVVINGQSTRATVNLTVTADPAHPEFAGDPRQLAPYRPALTANEVEHLLRKVGADGDDRLRNIGLTQGRAALVEAILNYDVDPAFDAQARNIADQYNYFDGFVNLINYWHSESLRAYYAANAIGGNPLRERMTLFFHHHFSMNLDSIQYAFGSNSNWLPREYFEIIHGQALGSFDSMLRAIRDDPGMSLWLNNSQNQYRSAVFAQNPAATTNDNFGRELMELFTIGRLDRFDQQLTYYTEADVKSAALAMTGQRCINGIADNPGYQGWYHGPGIYSDWALDHSYNGNVSMFNSYPAGTFNGAIIDKDTLVDHLLYNHPGTARNLAFKLLGFMAFPQVEGESIAAADRVATDTLAQELRNNRYELIPALRLILNSSLMFSNEARESCIESPAEQMVALARRLNLPLSALSTQWNIWTRESVLGQIMIGAGHPLFTLPNVFFGQRQCGASMENSRVHGESWLEDQILFNRLRSVQQLLDFTTIEPGSLWYANGVGLKFKTLLISDLDHPTADQVIDRLCQRFGVTVNAAQRRRILLTINPVSSPWSQASDALIEQRLATVVVALTAVYPQFIMR